MNIKVVKEYKLKGERNNRPRQPLILSDRLFVIFVYDKKGFTESRIQCLKTEDFSLVWEYRHAHVINNLVSVEGDFIVACCMNGQVKCFKAFTGELAWEYAITESNIGAISNVVGDKLVFSGVQARATSTWCIDTKGTLLWRQTNKGHSYIPVIHQCNIFNCIANDISCLSLADGSTVWTNTDQESYLFNPKIFNNCVLASGHGIVNFYSIQTGEKVAAISTDEGEAIWKIIHDTKNIFFGDEKGILYSYNCESIETGGEPTLNWRIDTGGCIQTVPLLKDNMIFLINDSKKLMLFGRENGILKFEIKIKGEGNISGITAGNNEIYFSCGGGSIYHCKAE